MGRPPKSLPRSKVVGVRFDTEEYAAITQKARATGLAPAEFVRVAALAKRLPKSETLPFDKLDQLRQIAVDINTMRRLAGVGAADKARLEATLKSLDALLAPIYERALSRAAEREVEA